MNVPTESSPSQSSNTYPEKYRHNVYRFLVLGVGVMLGMAAFEFLKQLLFPGITVWQSHIVTVFFTTFISLATAYLVTRKTKFMTIKISENNAIHRGTVSELRLSEEKLSKLFHANPDWIIISSLFDGCYIDVNDAFCRISGYQKEEVIGHTSLELGIWVDPHEREEMIPILLKEGRISDCEVRFCMKSGEIRYMLRSAELIDLEGEKAIISVCKDITERKNSEAALTESEERLRLLLKNSSDALVIINADGTPIYVSPGAERITGFPVAELEGRTIDTLIHPDDMKGITEAWSDAIEHPEKTVTVQYRHIHKTRDWVFSEAIAQSFVNEPAINGVIASVRDITERKKAEELLRTSEKKFEAVFLHSPVGLVLLNNQGEVLDCNQYLANVFGIQQGENVGINLLDKLPEGLVRQCLVNAISNKGVHHYEGPYTSVLSGKEIYISAFSEKVAPDLLIVIIIDITERKRAEDELKESEDKFSMTFKSSPDSVNINRLEDGLYVDVNEGFSRITGFTREDVIGKTSLELDIWENPDDRERMVKGLRENGYIENLEARFRKKDGSLLTGLMSARLIYPKGVPHLINITRDITELKTLESERLKIEKLESIGILAGGIAHDFNNILTGIMGNISFAKVLIDSDHKSYTALAEAEKAAVRAGELANQLLTFARGGEPIKKVVSSKDLVNEALSFVLRGSNVKGIVDIPDSIHALDVDEGQISQVFQNIIINATHAMPGGGVITITAQNEVLDGNNTLLLPPGPYLRFAFTDQGCGIPEGDLKRIFDPYFTTKSTGTGLGLASVHSIVSRHWGHITVKSTVGKGTAFTIYLPSIGQVYKKYKEDVAHQTADQHKGGSILIMDDEQMIREVASSMLTHLGYEVKVCADGEEAVELFKNSVESGTPYSMVIMDLTIPGGLGGKEAAERILSFYPEAYLVVSSGYSNDPIISKYQEYGFKSAIAKPYNINNFREVLGALHLSH
jgi:PAS domain S-box-containing protein